MIRAIQISNQNQFWFKKNKALLNGRAW